MSCQINPESRYRMPVVFGPAPGPRQHPEGRMWRPEETGRMRGDWARIAYRTDPAKLERILPPGFTPRGEPILSVSCARFHDVYWLGGRSYGILVIDFPATYHGKTETIEGNFCPVLWEGSPDAVMTGREELGFPKLFGDFTDLEIDEAAGTVRCETSWFGHKFFELGMTDLAQVDEPDRTLPGSDGGPQLYFKWSPRTSPSGREGADAAYVTTGAPPAGLAGVRQNINFDGFEFRKWTAKGSVAWRKATFEQLPVMFHAVNGIADLDMGEVVAAELVRFSGPGFAISLDAVRIVEPAE
jgi:hypothetical protein